MARQAGTQLILALGTFNAGEGLISAKEFSIMTKDKKARAKLLRETLSVVEKFNLSGVYFQWCFPGCPKVKPLQFYDLRY